MLVDICGARTEWGSTYLAMWVVCMLLSGQSTNAVMQAVSASMQGVTGGLLLVLMVIGVCGGMTINYDRTD